MYDNLRDLDPLLWPRLLVYGDLLQLVEHLYALYDLAEDGVLSVEVGGWSEGDEELATVGIHALVRHADDAARIVPEGGADLVFEELVRGVVDGGGGLGFGVRGRTAGLGHEVGDQAVEGAGIVEARGAEGEEVLGRLGHRLAEDLELDLTARGDEGDRHGALRTGVQGAVGLRRESSIGSSSASRPQSARWLAPRTAATRAPNTDSDPARPRPVCRFCPGTRARPARCH